MKFPWFEGQGSSLNLKKLIEAMLRMLENISTFYNSIAVKGELIGSLNAEVATYNMNIDRTVNALVVIMNSKYKSKANVFKNLILTPLAQTKFTSKIKNSSIDFRIKILKDVIKNLDKIEVLSDKDELKKSSHKVRVADDYSHSRVA